MSKAVAQALIPWRRRGEALKQSAKIEAGSTTYDREPTTRFDRLKCDTGGPGIVPGSRRLVRIKQVKTMVRDPCTFHGSRLGGAYIQAAVYGHRVAADNLAREPLGEPQGERCLAAGRRTNQHNERMERIA
jgi:hypothetical protein